jgi:hypothetical protein
MLLREKIVFRVSFMIVSSAAQAEQAKHARIPHARNKPNILCSMFILLRIEVAGKSAGQE